MSETMQWFIIALALGSVVGCLISIALSLVRIHRCLEVTEDRERHRG